jgi:hypothetical protein
MAKRIQIVKAPFNYRWPNRARVSVVRQIGIYPVGDDPGHISPDVAAAALEQGYAGPFDPAPAKRATTPRRRATRKADAATSDTGSSDRVGPAGVLPHVGPDDRAPVDDAG